MELSRIVAEVDKGIGCRRPLTSAGNVARRSASLLPAAMPPALPCPSVFQRAVSPVLAGSDVSNRLIVKILMAHSCLPAAYGYTWSQLIDDARKRKPRSGKRPASPALAPFRRCSGYNSGDVIRTIGRD